MSDKIKNTYEAWAQVVVGPDGTEYVCLNEHELPILHGQPPLFNDDDMKGVFVKVTVEQIDEPARVCWLCGKEGADKLTAVNKDAPNGEQCEVKEVWMHMSCYMDGDW